MTAKDLRKTDVKDLESLVEDLIRLKNCLHDLRAESFAIVAAKAVKAVDVLRQIAKEEGQT